ncbi:MAG: lytic transglycosylase domain-containing protein, partial [Gallionella sp.]|nr:lytic transglycosylase domain-containing protein [Gallionella sp.]
MRFFLYFLILAATTVLADDTTAGSNRGVVSELFSSFGIGPAAMPSTYDDDFIAAHNAFLAGDAQKLAQYAQRLKESPLEVYVSYYQLRLDLENADPRAVTAFLSRPDETPMIDLLRGEWLKILAKSGRWELFDAELRRLINKDVELTCYELQSRSRANYLLSLRDAQKLWFDGNTLPESCGTLFDAARSVGLINAQDLRQRLRLALELNNVTLGIYLLEKMEGSSAKLVSDLKKASADPDRYLRNLSLVNPGEVQRIIVLFALHRLAKQNPGLSVTRWSKISASFSRAERHYFYGWLGHEAARNLDDRALKWYKQAGDAPLNERQLAWRVRAALRLQSWPDVLSTIDKMPAWQQRDPAWRYWKARALNAMGKTLDARALFAPLSNEYHFYGQLAADELADLPAISEQHNVFKPSEYIISEVAGRPNVRRTIALYRTGMRGEALEEWRWVVRGMNDRELLAAAEVARRNEMYDRAIGAADMTLNLHDFSLRYLAPYRDTLQSHIRDNGLDEAWVYGLMRQESRFAHAAKSEVGAAGLMQIMPSTARWVASRLGLKDYRSSLLHDLDTNLRLGTYYMKAVLSQSDNSPVLASAAYNAGPLRALQWRGNQQLEGAIYAESIPFEETREYVKKVMSNTVYYADQFGTPPGSLKQRLGFITAKSPDNDRTKS